MTNKIIIYIKVLVLGENMPKFALPEIANLQLIWLRRRPAENCDGDMTQLHLRMTTGTRALLENFLTTVIQVIFQGFQGRFHGIILFRNQYM